LEERKKRVGRNRLTHGDVPHGAKVVTEPGESKKGKDPGKKGGLIRKGRRTNHAKAKKVKTRKFIPKAPKKCQRVGVIHLLGGRGLEKKPEGSLVKTLPLSGNREALTAGEKA